MSASGEEPDIRRLAAVEAWRDGSAEPEPAAIDAAWRREADLSAALGLAFDRRDEAELLTGLRRRLATRPQGRPSRRPAARLRWWWIPAAAAALVMIVLAASMLGGGGGSDDPPARTRPIPDRVAREADAAPPTPAASASDGRTWSPGESINADRPIDLTLRDGGRIALTAGSRVSLAAADRPLAVEAGSVGVTAAGSMALRVRGLATLETTGGGMRISLHDSPDGEVASVRVEAGAAVLRRASLEPIHLTTFQACVIPRIGAPMIMADGMAADFRPGGVEARLHGGRVEGDAWAAVPDAQPDRDLRAVDLMLATPLVLRGDELIEIDLRMDGKPTWAGLYLRVAGVAPGAADHGQDWPGLKAGGWITQTVPLADVAIAGQPHRTGSLWPGAGIDLIRVQCGPAAGTGLAVRSIRVIRPAPARR